MKYKKMNIWVVSYVIVAVCFRFLEGEATTETIVEYMHTCV